jgi:benzodiazapine receptor
VVWTVVVIVVATLIATLVLWTRRDIAYSLVIVWALVGIVVKRLDPNYFVELTIATIAGLGAAAILIVLAALVLLRSRPFETRKQANTTKVDT